MKIFVIQNKRFPFMDGDHDEIALRKWHREIGHGLMAITDEEKILFDNLSTEFADIPRNRSQLEKCQEKDSSILTDNVSVDQGRNVEKSKE